jgi:chloramphenicol 3-O-phosphotransferase
MSPMGSVIWINGSFSAGKTTIAKLLVAEIPVRFSSTRNGSAMSSATVSFRHRTTPATSRIFPLWRAFTRDAVISAAEQSASVIVVPMTVARPDYFDEIIGGIRQRAQVAHFTLMASRETILSREAARADATDDWAAQAVDRVLPELANERYATHLDAETQPPQNLAAEIFGRAGKS